MRLNSRIVLASIFGLGMVGSAFLLSGSESGPSALGQSDQSGVAVRAFIKTEDADQDGIPDWQNTLDIPTINLSEMATNTPLTKTAALAIDLAKRSLINASTSATSSLAAISKSLAAASVDRQYTKDDIKISNDNSLPALRAYGNRVAAITFEYAPPAATENEVDVFNRALLRKDPSILEKLTPTIESYAAMSEAMRATEVPSTLVREHLSLINVYTAMENDVRGFQGIFNDALPTMLRLRRYQADAGALYIAISNLYKKLDEQGIQWNDTDTASKFIKIERL